MSSCNNTTGMAVYLQWTDASGVEPYQILKIIFGSLSILLNGFLLLAIGVERRKLFASRVTYLVANLALADFLMGVVLVFIIQPLEIHKRKPALKELELPLIWAAMLVSFLTLFLMSAERFVVVSLPMLWSSILTTRRTIIGIGIIWCLAIIGGIVVHFHNFKAFFAMIIVIEFCVVVFIIVHLYILRFLKKPNSETALTDGDDEELQVTDVTTWPSAEQSNHVSMKQHGEVTAVVAILLAVLIFTMVPHFICVQLLLANILIDDTALDGIDQNKLYLAFEYTDALSFLNFVVNPIVYAWRLRMYRRAFVKLFRSFCGA